jgi:hypothetical protein
MKNRKRISVLMVLAMVMTLLAGLAAPAAATTPVAGVVIGHVPTVVAPGTPTLASIRFAEAGASIGNIQDGNTITVTLPSGVFFQAGHTVANLYVAGPNMDAATAAFSTGPTAVATDNSVTLTLDRTANSAFVAAAFTVTLPVNVTTVGAAGPINVTVTTNTTAISGGTFAVGTFATAAVTVDGTFATGTAPVTRSRFVVGPQGSNVNIRLRENAAGAFRTGEANRVVLTLPEGVTWAVYTPVGGIVAVPDPANARILRVTLATATTSATPFTISGIQLNISRLVPLGDLTVTVAGEGTNAGVTGSVVLARVADFDLAVRRPAAIVTPTAFNAGRANPVLSDVIELVETTPSSLIAGGTITLTLPAGFQWATAPGPTAAVTGTGTLATVPAAGTRVSESVYRFTVTGASTGGTSTVTFSIPADSILASPTAAAGDLVVAVAGTAAAAGNVTVATVRSAVTVAAATPVPRLRVGFTAQDASNIVITEAAGGRITAENITLTLPTGVTFSGTPTVTRTSGNITLGTIAAPTGTPHVLTIPVTAISTVASVITVSGIRYNVDRLVPDGDITVTVGGAAIVAPAVATAFPTRAVNARVGGIVSSVFTIGALSFVRDGVTTAIDAAPTIVDGRTLLPLRFAALAVGVIEDDIIWDAGRRTVTLLRGDRVVQLRIGDKNMTINGVVVPMDVAAAIVGGRTVLPISAVARALRAGIAWDATARTVTVTP